MFYRVRDENEKAIAEYQAAAKLADGASIEVKLGQAFQAKKDIPNAIVCYGKAISFKSDDPEVQKHLLPVGKKQCAKTPLAPEKSRLVWGRRSNIARLRSSEARVYASYFA